MPEAENIQLGFTLVELLISIAVVALLTTAILQGSSSFRDSSLLMKDVDSAENLLKDAYSRTLSSASSSSYGVYFGTSTIVLFRGLFYSASNPTNEVTALSPRVEISAVALTNSTTSVAFQRLTGYATATGTVTYRLKNNQSKTKIITIYESGLYKTQ